MENNTVIRTISTASKQSAHDIRIRDLADRLSRRVYFTISDAQIQIQKALLLNFITEHIGVALHDIAFFVLTRDGRFLQNVWPDYLRGSRIPYDQEVNIESKCLLSDQVHIDNRVLHQNALERFLDRPIVHRKQHLNGKAKYLLFPIKLGPYPLALISLRRTLNSTYHSPQNFTKRDTEILTTILPMLRDFFQSIRSKMKSSDLESKTVAKGYKASNRWQRP